MNFPGLARQAIGMIDAVLRRRRLLVREFGDRLRQAGRPDLRRGGFQERQDEGVLAAFVEPFEGSFRPRVFSKGRRSRFLRALVCCRNFLLEASARPLLIQESIEDCRS